MELFGHPFSAYTWKALIPLYHCGVPFEFRQVGPEEPDNNAVVDAASPLGKFPVLRDRSVTIFEASAIIDYLAATQTGCAALIPADPIAAVRERMIDRVLDLYVMDTVNRIVLAHILNPGAPDAQVVSDGQATLTRAYRWLDDWLLREGIPEPVTLVTAAAVPALFYGDWVWPVADQGCSRLFHWRAQLLALPAVSRVIDQARPFRPMFPPGAPDRD